MDSSPDTSMKNLPCCCVMGTNDIIEALEVCEGNISEAARQLGIGRNTLYRKMKEYEIGVVTHSLFSHGTRPFLPGLNGMIIDLNPFYLHRRNPMIPGYHYRRMKTAYYS